ncbi:MAG TPA: chromate efflux transporter [Gemmatimonadales bacterium]|nr:chromate efflux transporter [Gemmatimonadales bacterium]
MPTLTPLDLARYFLRLGTFGFGGPIALVGAMHRDLVERRGWLSEAEYREGIALAQVAPGPLAFQLAIYVGYVRAGLAGAAAVGLAFVLPSFLMVLALGWAYRHFGGLGWMQAVFYGVGAAVIALIARSAYKLTVKTLGRDRLLWGIYMVLAAATIATRREPVPLILLAGLVSWLWRAPPSWLGRTRAAPEAGSVLLLLHLFGFFTLAGAFVFGSGLAIVPFLYGGVVRDLGWLSEREFLDAVAVALITPGPVVITTGFIGFLVAGTAGAVVAAAGTFLPSYLLTILPLRWFRRYGDRPWVSAAVGGVTAAATGAIAGAAVVLARGSIVDAGTAGIALLALAATFVPRLPEPLIVVAAGLAGLVLFPG